MAGDTKLFNRLLSLSEERFGLAVGDLLSSEGFLKSVERAVSSGAAARSAIETGTARLLSIMNVPTLDDLMKVERKLEELEELIGDTVAEVDRIEAAVRGSGKQSRRKGTTRKRSTSSKTRSR